MIGVQHGLPSTDGWTDRKDKLGLRTIPKCKTLNGDDLDPLLVWVDKENSIEFSFDCYTLLVYILYLSSPVHLL